MGCHGPLPGPLCLMHYGTRCQTHLPDTHCWFSALSVEGFQSSLSSLAVVLKGSCPSLRGISLCQNRLGSSCTHGLEILMLFATPRSCFIEVSFPAVPCYWKVEGWRKDGEPQVLGAKVQTSQPPTVWPRMSCLALVLQLMSRLRTRIRRSGLELQVYNTLTVWKVLDPQFLYRLLRF